MFQRSFRKVICMDCIACRRLTAEGLISVFLRLRAATGVICSPKRKCGGTSYREYLSSEFGGSRGPFGPAPLRTVAQDQWLLGALNSEVNKRCLYFRKFFFGGRRVPTLSLWGGSGVVRSSIQEERYLSGPRRSCV